MRRGTLGAATDAPDRRAATDAPRRVTLTADQRARLDQAR